MWKRLNGLRGQERAVAHWPGTRPVACLDTSVGHILKRNPLRRQRRVPVSRHAPGSGHRRRDRRSSVHTPMCHGDRSPGIHLAAGRASQDTQNAEHRSHGPGGVPVGPRRPAHLRNFPLPTERQPGCDRRPQTPTASSSGPMGPTPQESVADGRIKSPISPYPHPMTSSANETPPVSPIPPRARPPPAGQRPRNAHADTPTPRN